MSKLKCLIVLSVFGLATTFGLSSASAVEDLPAGAGVEVVRDKCLLCHEADLIVQQRLGKPGWVREVDKMIRWGSVLTEAEKTTVVDYLALSFPPRKSSTASTGEKPGKSLFEDKCLLCHGIDLTEQQRLARAGWTREVEKMVRWGAEVSDTEKPLIVDYLADKYPVR
jgi:cytochrome c5